MKNRSVHWMAICARDMDENSPYSRRGKDFSSYIACEFLDETEGTHFVTGVVFDCRSDGTFQERFFLYDGIIPENCFLENQEAMDFPGCAAILNSYMASMPNYTIRKSSIGRLVGKI